MLLLRTADARTWFLLTTLQAVQLLADAKVRKEQLPLALNTEKTALNTM